MVSNTGTPTLDATQYRPDVDGLRAIAVLLVVAHHVRAPLLPGGFIGVDIFFVISGFLIINQIVTGIAKGRFSFGEFWARRALRILPPYLLVIIVSAIVASFILATDEEFQDFGNQVFYSALMVVNHLFLMEQGYFDADAKLKPLLHLWSLAVEEQFYLVAPILLVGLAWIWGRSGAGRMAAAAIVIAIGATSFVLCVWLTGVTDDRNYAFYLMPLRIWEFMAGGAIALAAPFAARLPRKLLDGMGLIGLALIGFAMIAFSSRTSFPGVAAIVPVLGASALILVGMVHPAAWASRLLAQPVLVGIGLVSYSWYLWHWPLLAFTRIYNFGDRDPLFDMLIGAGLSLGLAVLTYHFLEKPIRAWGRRTAGRMNWRVAFSGLAACAVVAVGGPLQAASVETTEVSAPEQPQAPRSECILRNASSGGPCIETAEGRPIGIILGDSHGTAAHPVLSAYAERNERFLADSAFNGCSPLLGVGLAKKANSARCAPWHENARRLIGELRPRFAILSAQWQFHVHDNAPMWMHRRNQNQREFFIESLRNTIATLKESGVARVLIVGPVPLWRQSAPRCLAHWLKHQRDPVKRCGWTYARVVRDRAKAVEWLKQAVAGLAGVRLADPIKALCTKAWCRPYVANNTLLYSDRSHLSDQGVKQLLSGIEHDLRWVMDIQTPVATSR